MARRTSFFAPCSVDYLFERSISRKQLLHILHQLRLWGSLQHMKQTGVRIKPAVPCGFEQAAIIVSAPIALPLFIDAIHDSVRGNSVIRELAAYVIPGITCEGRKELLSMLIELRNRSVI